MTPHFTSQTLSRRRFLHAGSLLSLGMGLHQLGLDHEHLTYRHGGRDHRLTDVHVNIIEDILS